MATCDYYLCDVCGCKTFYDVDLHYDDDSNRPVGAGDMAVLCCECAKTHRIKIVKESDDE